MPRVCHGSLQRFVDLQVNGFLGREFGDPRLTVDDVEQIGRALDSHGCVGFAPTVTTNSFDILHHALSTLRRACDERPAVACRVVGFHLEGPYIAREDGPRGAHPLAHARPPDWDEFRRLQDAAGGRIRILTMSPEYENSPQFIRRATDSGVVIAIGHTAANSEQIKAAVDAGARFSTHLGNGAHGQIRRHPN
jgi:N-acetylglucosamine-6-phosphate deacetylase